MTTLTASLVRFGRWREIVDEPPPGDPEIYKVSTAMHQRCTQHPDNVWALHGLVECLQRRGETDQLPALEAKLAAALAKVDVPITSSCMCRTKVHTPRECCT